MAITHVGTYWSSVETDNTTATLPGGYQAGDVGILFFGIDSYAGSVTVSNGWTIERSEPYASRQATTGVAYKVLGASESNPQVSFDSTHWVNVILFVFRGVDTTTVLDTASTYFTIYGDTTPDAPDITTVTDNAAIVSYWYNNWYEASGNTAPAGYTLDTTPAEKYDGGAYLLDSGSAGLKALGTWTLSGMSGDVTPRLYTVALRPVVAGGGGGQSLFIGSTEYSKAYLGDKPLTAMHVGGVKTFEAT